MSTPTLKEMIESIRVQRARREWPMQSPITEDEIISLRREMVERLGLEAPERYLDLLRINNGISENGLRIFASHRAQDVASDLLEGDFVLYGIVESNLEYRDNRDHYDQLLIFAETETYVFAEVIGGNRFIKLAHVEEVPDSTFRTFDELMIDAMQLALLP